MKRKKNFMSYPIWIVFALVTGLGAFSCIQLVLQDTQFTILAQIALCIGVFAVAGVIVFCLRKISTVVEDFFSSEPKSALFACTEAVVLLGLLAAGLIMRSRGIGHIEEQSVYYDIAAVQENGYIPMLVHGAVYLYLQMLHAVFYLIGNKITAIIWLQIGMQLCALILLYFGVRNAVGRIAGLFLAGFLCLSPTMIGMSLTLSPVVLYFFLWSLVFCIAAAEAGKKEHPVSVFLLGVMEALLVYLDIAGLLLVFFSFSLLFCSKRERIVIGRRIQNGVSHLLGVFAGLFACFAVDAYCSSKTVISVFHAWYYLFFGANSNASFLLDTSNATIEYVIIFFFLCVGVFSFWLTKNDNVSFWVLTLMLLLAATYVGIFTEEIPGSVWIYLFSAVLASTGLENCFCYAGSTGYEEEARDFRALSLTEPSGEASDEPSDEQSDNTSGSLYQNKQEDTTASEGDGEADTDNSGNNGKIEFEKLGNESDTKVQYLENPLPLPKKHEKKTMSFVVENLDEDDFDLTVSEEDDFDY